MIIEFDIVHSILNILHLILASDRKPWQSKQPMFGCAVPIPHQAKITAGSHVCSEATTYSSFSKSRQCSPWDARKLAPPLIQRVFVVLRHTL